jgi:uncharacterized membrane protein
MSRLLPWPLNNPLRLRFLLLGLLVVAFILRFHYLYASGLWFDEAASYFIASKGLSGILDYARLAPGEHPPTYYWPLLLWMNAAGTTEFALRYFSVWFGMLFIPLFYRFARRHFDFRLALLATVLSVPMPFLVNYSQEARMYTMVMCLSVLAMDYFLRWAAGDRDAALKHFLFLLLATSVHYYAILLMAAQDVYLLGRRDLWRPMGKLVVLWHLLLVAALSAWFFTASGVVVSAGRAFTNPIFAGRSLEEMSRIAIDLTVGGVVIRPLSTADYALAASAWVLILVGALWAHRHLDAWTRGVPLRAWLFALAIVPPLLATVVPYVYAARYLFVTAPALLLLMAVGLLGLQQQGRLALVLGSAALIATFAYGLNFTYGFIKSPYREMASIVAANALPADGLILEGTSQWPLAYYYLPERWPQKYIPQSVEAAELVDIDPSMRAMQTAHPRLWVLSEQASIVDPGNNVPRWLSINAYPANRYWFQYGQAVAFYYAGNRPLQLREWNAQFGEWMVLEQSVLSAPLVAAGDGLAVELRWHAVKPIPQSLQLLVTLRLYNSQGHVVQERVTKPCDGFCPIDNWPPGETVIDRHGLLVPDSLQAGEYSLRLEVYSPRQGQSLPIQIVQVSPPSGHSLELTRISVRNPAASGR